MDGVARNSFPCLEALFSIEYSLLLGRYAEPVFDQSEENIGEVSLLQLESVDLIVKVFEDDLDWLRARYRQRVRREFGQYLNRVLVLNLVVRNLSFRLQLFTHVVNEELIFRDVKFDDDFHKENIGEIGL